MFYDFLWNVYRNLLAKSNKYVVFTAKPDSRIVASTIIVGYRIYIYHRVRNAKKLYVDSKRSLLRELSCIPIPYCMQICYACSSIKPTKYLSWSQPQYPGSKQFQFIYFRDHPFNKIYKDTAGATLYPNSQTEFNHKLLQFWRCNNVPIFECIQNKSKQDERRAFDYIQNGKQSILLLVHPADRGNEISKLRHKLVHMGKLILSPKSTRHVSDKTA
jgi:Zn ribbon nucleic-acid-binding protein